MLSRARAAFRAASILALVGGATAQTVIVTPNCTAPAYNWTTNSLGQSPCQMSALALSVCSIGTVSIPALTSNISVYQGPTGNDATDICKCNTVLYSLISACAGCQGGIWEPYALWIANCTVTPSPEGQWPADQVGFPKNTAFPAWAFLPISNLSSSGNLWNNTEALAYLQSNQTEVSSLPGPTSSASTNTASATLAAESQIPSAAPAPSTSGSSHAGAIAGGVVGGVVGAALLAAFAWLLIHHNRRRVAPSAEFLDGNSSSNIASAPAFVGEAATVHQPATSRKFYDPSDPSTYPDALAGSNGHAFGSPGPTTASPGPTINTTHREQGHQPMASWGSSAETSGDYRGLPEV